MLVTTVMPAASVLAAVRGENPNRPQQGDRTAARSRAESIVGQMTTAEKIGLVTSHFALVDLTGEHPDMPICSGFTTGVPRLGVPDLRVSDASLGVANALNARPDDTATALPAALAMGASFDPELVRLGSAMIGVEARAKTFNVLLAGGINLIRDAWAGRNFEYFSEDALLSGLLGAAAVDGVQSNEIASTVKHFVLNPQETGRMIVDSRITSGALRESDLLAFQIAIERGRPASVMAAYNKVNGEWMSENAPLVQRILKEEWGFEGWVMSDWGGTHSTAKAALAGLDQESGMELDTRLNGAIFFTDRLARALDDGEVPAARLDDMVTRILVGLIGCGAFDNPVPSVPRPVDDDSHALIAQRVAEAGIVLLRNEEQLLPLDPRARKIAVIGGNADLGVMSGGGSSQVRSNGGAPIEESLESSDASWFCRMTYHASAPLAAIREAAPAAEVTFCSGDDRAEAIRQAADADVAVIFVTQWRTEALDLATLALPDQQDGLIAEIAAANPNTVVVLQTGGAVLMPWLSQVKAVLASWYPGQRGGTAIARILFGDVVPSGRLPITFPASDHDAPRAKPCGIREMQARDEAKAAGDAQAVIAPFAADYQEGANVGYRWHEMSGRPALFPFGFGLSYTTFVYDGLEIIEGDNPKVRLKITNSGDRHGADVPQIYVRAADGEGTETWRLAGFKRVELEAGSTSNIEIGLEPRTYSRWQTADNGAGGWRRDANLALAVARSSNDFVIRATLGG